MPCFAPSSLLATLFLALSASALPYPVSYSVVNVDGGSQGASTSPTTIYHTVTESADSDTITVVSTPSTTAVLTDYTTIWSHAEVTETALIPAVSPESTSHPTGYVSIYGPSPNSYVPIYIPSSSSTPEATVTVVSTVTPTPTATTSYYDNGMWHTSYAIKNFYSSRSGQWMPTDPAVSFAATGTGARLAVRAQPTGYGYGYAAGGWNSTRYW